ncbi:MAG: hypothetical protein AAF446_03920 [Pseudomonadota bacterium]
MKFKSIWFAVFLVFLAGNTPAQLLNGDFSNQGDYWDLYRADTLSALCYDNLSLEAWSGGDLLWRGGSNDWAASLHDGWSGIRGQSRNTCGRVQQTLIIPPGTRLKYSLKLGTIFNVGVGAVGPNHRRVTFTGNIETPSSNQSVGSFTGRSVNSPCFTGCPRWSTKTFDVSDFWGQSVDLTFSAESSYSYPSGIAPLGSNPPSPAYIDNILFEEIPANRFVRAVSGMWYNPNRNGSGIQLARSPTGRLLAHWATYLPNGSPVWYTGEFSTIRQGELTATLKKVTRDPASGTVQLQSVGTADITMLASRELIFEWNLTAASGSPSQGGEKMVHLFGGDSYTGMWFEPAFSGWGVTLDVEGVGSSAVSIATIFFYTPSGQPTWAQGAGNGDLAQNVSYSVNTFTGIGLCPGCAGQSQSLQVFPAGTFGLQDMDTQPAGFSAIQTLGGISWIRGSSGAPVSLGRLTIP